MSLRQTVVITLFLLLLAAAPVWALAFVKGRTMRPRRLCVASLFLGGLLLSGLVYAQESIPKHSVVYLSLPAAADGERGRAAGTIIYVDADEVYIRSRIILNY